MPAKSCHVLQFTVSVRDTYRTHMIPFRKNQFKDLPAIGARITDELSRHFHAFATRHLTQAGF